VLLCGKVCAGLVVNTTTVIPQTDKARRILLAVSFRVRNRLLNIDFRLRWCVNGTHLSLCAVARFEVPETRMDMVRADDTSIKYSVAPTLQTRRPGPSARNIRSHRQRVIHKVLITANEVVLTFPSLRRVLTQSVTWGSQQTKKGGRRGGFRKSASFSAWLLSLVRLSVLDSFIVQVVLGRTVIGTAYHRLHTDILHLRDQT
jgi:hypothetical protein